MAPALLTRGLSVSIPDGDGLGGMSWTYCMGEFIREFGWPKYLADDIFYNPYFGGGLNPPAAFFQPWKIIYGFLSQFLSMDQVWDLVIFTGISLTALATYWIGILLKLRPLFAFACGLLLISMENIDARITGHNTLAFWFAPLLQWGCMILWCRSFSWFWVLALSLISIVSVASNEYFAWYGGLFALSFGCVQLYFRFRAREIPMAKLILQSVVSLALIVGLLKIIFPSMFSNLYMAVSKKPSAGDYNLYSYRTPGSIFVPNLLIEFNWLERKWHGVKGEMTFRLGFIFWASFGVLLSKYRKLHSQTKLLHQKTLMSLLISGLFLMFCALPTNSFPWVSLLFSEIVPMFRSIVRAMLFFNVSMIFIFILMLQSIFDSLKTTRSIQIYFIALAIVTPVLIFDMGPFHRNFKPYPAFPLPSADPSELALSKLEKGMLLELPIENHRHEKGLDSFMMFRYSIHHKPILNWVATSLPSPHEHAYEYLRQLTHLDPTELVENARLLGSKYLLVDNKLNFKISTTNAKKIVEGPLRTAYEIIDPKEITIVERDFMLSELDQKKLVLGPYQIH